MGVFKLAGMCRLALALMVVVLLGACSGMRIVDAQVQAYAAAPQALQLPADYRFDRLPSQTDPSRAWTEFEALVQEALDQVGMRRNDTSPQYTVSYDLRVVRDPRAPWDDLPYGYGYHRFPPAFVRIDGVVVLNQGFGLRHDIPYYRREVHIVVRRLSDREVVFESRAKHDGLWHDDIPVLRAMLTAALRDFPNPPAGVRRVDIELPR